MIALLVNPSNANAERIIQEVREAAGPKGLQLRILKAISESEIDVAFTTLIQARSGALVVGADPFFDEWRDRLLELWQSRHAIPTIYFARQFALEGGLISYGSSITGTWRQVGVLAACRG